MHSVVTFATIHTFTCEVLVLCDCCILLFCTHSGLLGMLVVPIAAANDAGQCLLHATFENVVWCSLRLPKLVSGCEEY